MVDFYIRDVLFFPQVLEKQGKALLKIPGRKEKTEADALRAELAQARISADIRSQ